ncbi:ASIC1 [Branchiostoma lanceolatum]|uniref:ASIC1 protein n=1 Tax=Branchiostoma lanceolatum TaxID=7740 RepID=A0A8J9VJ65_BRALA|nr:ASIC1 [Branchiostoma lanceolatum]
MGLKTRGLGWLRFNANSGDLDTTVVAPPAAFRDPPLPTWAHAAFQDPRLTTLTPSDMKHSTSPKCLLMPSTQAKLKMETKLKKEPKLLVECKRSDLTHFANNSTLHGLPRVFPERSKGWDVRRGLWAVTVVTMILVFLYWGVSHIGTYFRYPVTTKLHLQEATELFPAVTICNLNTYRVSQLTRDDLYSWGELMGILHPNRTLKDHNLPYLNSSEERILELARFSEEGHENVSLWDVQNRTGHDLGDMVKKCTFREEPCTSSMFTPVSNTCNASMFTPVSNTCNANMFTPVSNTCNANMFTPVSNTCNANMFTPLSNTCNANMFTPVSSLTPVM